MCSVEYYYEEMDSMLSKVPTTCESQSVSTLSDCEAACNAHEPCVGYYYSANSTWCNLIPSKEICPTGYEMLTTSIDLNPSSDNMIAVKTLNEETSEFDCYAKNWGKFLS